jgi:hypothetical protein
MAAVPAAAQAAVPVPQPPNLGNAGNLPPVVFARTPAEAHTGVLDYTNPVHIKIYTKAGASLPTKFSTATPDVKVLRTEFQSHATEFGLTGIFSVNISKPGDPPRMRSLLTHHGEITLLQATVHANVIVDSNDRRTQNDTLALLCLKASINETTTRAMVSESDLYTTGQTGDKESGILFYKVLLSKAEVDTNATAKAVRMNLSHLDQYMREEAKNNILLFNTYVRDQMNILSSRGQDSPDLLSHVFEGYLECSDQDFHAFAREAERHFDMNKEEYTWESLLAQGEQQYSIAKTKSKWMHLSKEQEEIISLRAEIQRQSDKPKPSNRDKGKPPNNQSKKTHKGAKKTKKVFTGESAWRMTRGEGPTTKTVNGSTWKWCSHHAYWCDHHDSECRKKKAAAENKKESVPGMTLQASMAAIGVDDVYDAESDSSDE